MASSCSLVRPVVARSEPMGSLHDAAGRVGRGGARGPLGVGGDQSGRLRRTPQWLCADGGGGGLHDWAGRIGRVGARAVGLSEGLVACGRQADKQASRGAQQVRGQPFCPPLPLPCVLSPPVGALRQGALEKGGRQGDGARVSGGEAAHAGCQAPCTSPGPMQLQQQLWAGSRQQATGGRRQAAGCGASWLGAIMARGCTEGRTLPGTARRVVSPAGAERAERAERAEQAERAEHTYTGRGATWPGVQPRLCAKCGKPCRHVCR